MVQELRLFRFVDGVNDTPFPNKEANDEQIVITSFAYNAQRMAATPTITASIDYYRCLDDDWDVNVYAEYKGEKYYIRQIPSSSKSNTSVMYKHDLTLYSERFVLENIYFTDIEKKKENGIDVFVKRETTSIIYRFNLIEYVDRLNWSLEASNLPYRVSIDSSILNSDKAKEIKDILLENAYLANAIQEIYNQWETFFYFNGNNIIIKDCSENINDVVLEYGAENSLLSIKKNNANFRKITRISGYGSDKNIPFYYPNWSQKGVIDAMPLNDNSIITKDMITITDMKKFDKKMPLNGKVKYFLRSETHPIYDDATLNKNGLKYKNKTSTEYTFTIPFESIRENNSVVDIYFDVDIYEEVFPTINSQYLYYDIYEASGSEGIQVLADLLHSNIYFDRSFLMPISFTDNVIQNAINSFNNRLSCNVTLESSSIDASMNIGSNWKGKLNITRKLRICLTCNSVPKGKYDINIVSLFNIAEAIKEQDKIGYYYKKGKGKAKDYFATLNEEQNFINIKLSNFSIVFPESDADEGWYLNDTKKINLSDIGIAVNGTPNGSWSGEGFMQESVSKIPTAQNLMPSLYRNSIGERKFYNAINYPRSTGSNDQDDASGEISNGLMYENENYKDNGEYYNFETPWTPTNQNEHIQEFADIYPSITNVTNANNEPIDEILEVAFDDNDNNEVDEEGNYIHPYFYVRIPKFDGNNGFNLFDHKIVGGNMQVAMTSGDCAACNFEIMVKTRTSQGNDTYEDVVNPIKLKENGTLVDGDSDKKTAGDFGTEDATQQDSRNNSIWLVLKKDNQTFNEAYPNKLKGVVPKVGDKFVLLNIDMPRSYVLEAEEKLTKEVIKYMSQNNSDKWNFNIDFSRIYLEENPNFTNKLDENCKLNVKYNGNIYNFYVNDYKYEVKANEALPKITVGLVDTITVNRGITQNLVDGVMKAINQTYDVEASIDYDALYFRKTVPETIPYKTTFGSDVDVQEKLKTKEVELSKIQSHLYGGDEVMGTGFKLEEDKYGNSTLTVDNVNVRKKLKATEFVIQQIQFQGGIVIQSAAAMECNNVETLDNGNFKCYFDTKEGSVSNQFMLDDLARCQRVGYAPKYYWRKVVEVGSDYIVLSNVVGEYEEGSDTPSEGDIIVQMGNTTNTDRQSAIEMNTVGENSPSFIMYSGINTFSLLEKDVTGIVYHQKVVDENGNTTIDAYPELYSYGSMYFGDRAKQNNFIQFAPNANGTFEMLINAKTSFKGGVSDLSVALNNLLDVANNAQYAADNAISIAEGATAFDPTNLIPNSVPKKLGDWRGVRCAVEIIDGGGITSPGGSSSNTYIFVPLDYKQFEVGSMYTLSFLLYVGNTGGAWTACIGNMNEDNVIDEYLIDFGEYFIGSYGGEIWRTIEVTGEATEISEPTGYFGLFIKTSPTYLSYKNFKLEKGSNATTWNPAPNDIDVELAEVSALQSEFQESLEVINSDEYFSIAEKKAIRTQWEAISGDTTVDDNADYYSEMEGSFGEALRLAPSELDRADLFEPFEALRTFLADDSDGLYQNDDLYQDTNRNWGSNGRITMSNLFTAYYNAEIAWLQNINNYIAEQTLESAKDEINTTVNNLEIGGVNLIPFNNIALWNGTQVRQRPKITITANPSTYYGGVYIPASYIQLNTKYVLSFKIQKTSGSIVQLGGHIGAKISEVYIDGEKMPNSWFDTNAITDDTNEHYVVVKFTQTEKIKDNNLYIQPNRDNYTLAFTCIISEIQLEIGNQATAYKPNDADKINATENILKDSFLVKMSSGSEDKWTCRQYNPLIPLKPNTEYVFSVFKSSAKSDNASANRTATKFTIRIMDSIKSVNKLMTNIPISDTLQVYKFITPASIVDTDVVLIYNGQVDNENGGYTTNGTKYQNTTMYGLMLAEGNVYSPWKAATPEEEGSMYLLKDAIAGSTEIEGGLVLTNLIELKNQSGTVTAGINGLDTTQGGVNSALRFWAGGSLGSSSSASFRVYDDGRVFGTHFYGFNSAIKVTKDNYSNYLTEGGIDLKKTGNVVFLDRSLVYDINIGEQKITITPKIAFPTNVEDYIGAELTIINPHQIPIQKHSNILNQTIGTSQIFSNETSTSYKVYSSSTSNTKGEMKQLVQILKNDNSYTSVIGSSNYTPFFSIFYNGFPTVLNGRFVTPYAIQIYRLYSTPYIRFPNGKQGDHLFAFGNTITVNGYEFRRYAFWALTEQKSSLPISESYS